MSFVLKNISWYQHLKEINLELPQTGFVAIIGPNGAGKSSLMNLLSRWEKPTNGEILWKNKSLSRYSPLELAQQMAWLPQNRQLSWDLSVKEVVALGAYARRHILHNATKDKEIYNILQEVELTSMAMRSAQTLSGGEQSRMHLARLMASNTNCWLLDEFDAGLDWHHSLKAFSLLKKYSRNKLVICIIHDLNIAKKLADWVILLHQGELQYDGSAKEVMQTQKLSPIWQVEMVEKEDGWLAPQFQP
ncbi:MAG: ABC transporter ATP-binding protein [Alphaproteobacteria bacterium]